MNEVQGKTQDDPLKVFKKAVDNVKPVARGEEPPRRRLELPGPGRGEPRTGARRWRMRWLIAFARKRPERGMVRSWPTSSWTPPTCAAAR